uniref:Uncharacterized protein n=1 Tax=Acrobeloides nanus TaxID=290746 RepID=A0A914C2V9_9BILA
MIPIPGWLQNWINELWYLMMDSERKRIQELQSIRDQAINESSMIDKKIENILNEVKDRKDRYKGEHNLPTSSQLPVLAYTPQLPNQSLAPYNVENGAPNQVAYQQPPQLYQNQGQLALAHNQQAYLPQKQNIQNQQYQQDAHKHNSKNGKKPKKKDNERADWDNLIVNAVKTQSAIDEALQEQYRADSEEYCKPLSFKPLPISPVEDDNSVFY